jgi:hypothetical protein
VRRGDPRRETRTLLQENVTMRRNLCLIGLTATLALALAPAAASAETYQYHFRGNSAYAAFASTESTGCIFTWTDVSLYETRYQDPPGPPEESAAAYLFIYQYDYCQDVYLMNAAGYTSLPADAFQVPHSLQSAQVTASLTAYDYQTGNPIPVTIDLAWTGVGDIARGSSNYRYSYPHYRSMSHSIGSNRAAEVSGTVLLGTTNLAAGSSAWGSLWFSQSGSVSIWR